MAPGGSGVVLQIRDRVRAELRALRRGEARDGLRREEAEGAGGVMDEGAARDVAGAAEVCDGAAAVPTVEVKFWVVVGLGAKMALIAGKRLIRQELTSMTHTRGYVVISLSPWNWSLNEINSEIIYGFRGRGDLPH